jgi:uncharacterized membrane protein YphA (DoxX/SURF4 family)
MYSWIIRLLIAFPFMSSAIDKLLHMDYQMILYPNIPLALLVCGAGVEFFLSILLILGYKPRFVTIALVIYLLGNALSASMKYGNDFSWVIYQKDIAIFGALLLVLQQILKKDKVET